MWPAIKHFSVASGKRVLGTARRPWRKTTVMTVWHCPYLSWEEKQSYIYICTYIYITWQRGFVFIFPRWGERRQDDRSRAYFLSQAFISLHNPPMIHFSAHLQQGELARKWQFPFLWQHVSPLTHFADWWIEFSTGFTRKESEKAFIITHKLWQKKEAFGWVNKTMWC